MLPKNPFPFLRFAALVAVLLLPVMLLAACGGDDAATTAPVSETPASTQAAVPQDTPVPTDAPVVSESEPTKTPEPTSTPENTPEPPKTEEPTAEPTEEPAMTPVAQADPAATEVPAPTVEPIPTEPPAPVEPCEGTEGGEVGNCAPEFAGTQEWINSEPLSIESLRGKVVLIDFWTYSCINCIRTIPFLQTWYERYADEGLVIVGVHTPEFEFEKVYQNVAEATGDMGVAWPVLQDNDRVVWDSYSNHFWPAKYLIDKDGVIQYRHFGEGEYAETEEEIRRLLAEVGAAPVALQMPLPEDRQERDATFLAESGGKVTPELFAGWRFTTQRGGIGQQETYSEAAQVSYRRGEQSAEVAEFQTPSEVEVDHIYFQGPWAVGPESVQHARETESVTDDFVLLAYSARSVNAVLTSGSGDPYKVVVKINNEYLTDENKGEDIMIGEDGESYLMVSSPKAYKLVEHPTWMTNQYIQMFSTSDDFGLFSFTFGTYEDGF